MPFNTPPHLHFIPLHTPHALPGSLRAVLDAYDVVADALSLVLARALY
jgi:hypothetical protein